ncbi:hypothetical protein T310_1289 [Rasamsonia emersonii CBS 393.64]|uniref:Uncharacterized protein n=1 Tax=Rasamsonia emersonii (strain ATCC 16479 / CBS 393.64 / IMI 116815) TaxID=1408163 RepID=A0A0F4Z2G3_RASE3|nr:hypothetical protein T310_1289 [Rasamsonia emersonii CBS 393.64]KKA24682.1 hypothetical protein T310_1289 [Rasamsonia emersonii CBS 393.64]
MTGRATGEGREQKGRGTQGSRGEGQKGSQSSHVPERGPRKEKQKKEKRTRSMTQHAHRERHERRSISWMTAGQVLGEWTIPADPTRRRERAGSMRRTSSQGPAVGAVARFGAGGAAKALVTRHARPGDAPGPVHGQCPRHDAKPSDATCPFSHGTT